MAAIDSLLKLLESQGADALIIQSSEVPVLLKTGTTLPLSMPRLEADVVSSFVGEILGDTKPPVRGEDARTGTYQSLDGSAFAYTVEHRGGGFRLSLLDGSSTESPTPQPMASPRPVERGYDATGQGNELLRPIAEALQRGASDIFLSAGEPPRARLRGRLEVLTNIVYDSSAIHRFCEAHFQAKDQATLEKAGSVDIALELDVGQGRPERFRANVFLQHQGVAVALRPIRSQAPSLKSLNLPQDLTALVKQPHGLVLVTGPTGSGKSTTLAALVEHLNQTQPWHIVTLEDPIEYRFVGGQALIHQREFGRHFESFSTGLRAALRESPDVILLGEMRDLATTSAALTAAETGHLVLSTLHTGSAVAAVDRIVDLYPAQQQPQVRCQLADTLRAVLSQRLLPTLSGHGRVPALEKLVVNDAVACQIREGRAHHIHSQLQSGRDEGMITLERSLADLVASRKTTVATAMSAARDRAALESLLVRRI